MAPAVFTVTDVAITAGAGLFKAQGKVLKFDGHRRVWPPGGKQEDELLPALGVGQPLDLHALDATQHFTQPPPRYSEATLIKALEKEAIGRPSTYAPIIQTIQDRHYVEQKERRFFATDLGMVVTDLLVKHFPKILDLKFTAHMEDELDDIASAKEDMVKVLDEFYYPFQEALKAAETQMERVPDPDRARPATSAARRWCSSSAGRASSWAARSTPSARRPGRSAASPGPRPSRASTPARSAASRC